MTRLQRLFALLAALPLIAAADAVAQQRTSPGAVPAWTRTLKLPDGRTFVSDGALMIDAAVAKPAALPAVVIPPESSQAVARNFTAAFDKEVPFASLRPGSLANSFVTPDGIGISGNYVSFLRGVVPVGQTRLRTKGPRDPIVVMMGDRSVAIVMPMVMPPQ